MEKSQKVMLISGSNSGIGLASTRLAVKKGFIVYGGARRETTFSVIEAEGAHPIALDVTDEQSMVEAVRQIEAKHGVVDVLVNNAGYGQLGPIEAITPVQLHQQFETNVFGLVRMAQLVIPAMRRQRWGRIINISSMGGEFTFPLAGAYHATKYAVESINAAMRFELKPFGIDVVTIQPAPVTTPLAKSALETIEMQPDSPYQKAIDGLLRFSEQTIGYISADQVAKVILDAAMKASPQTRYKVGTIARVLPFLNAILSDRMWDRMLARIYG
jgi:NAD(P)-dependent dehydrogenase (short-subunit alcohol dehydrogenase family)